MIRLSEKTKTNQQTVQTVSMKPLNSKNMCKILKGKK